MPPVRAFWSLTMYDPESYLVANAAQPLLAGRPQRPHLRRRRVADPVHPMRRTCGLAEANWLPAPSQGGFKVALRLYSPKPEVAHRNLAAAAHRTRRLRTQRPKSDAQRTLDVA